MFRGVCSLLALLFAAAAVCAAERISLEVRVTGKGDSGKQLARSDFELRENGKPQNIEVEYVGAEGSPEGQSNLWVYIGLDIFAQGHSSAQKAILKFIDEQHKPGIMVSLGGSPFTGSAADLRSLLLPGPPLSQVPVRGQPLPGLLPMWNIGYGVLVHGRPMLERYTALVQQLGALPGKKAVVLFRDGLRLDQDGLDTTAPDRTFGALSTSRPSSQLPTSTVGGLNAEPTQHKQALERLASEALRNRVSFYPVTPFGGNMGAFSSDGLSQVANVTGGHAVLSEGDPAVIFSRLLEDAVDYYVLSYEPSNPAQNGRKRRIDVKLKQKGLRAHALREYVEREPGERVPQPAAMAQPAALTVDDQAMKELLAAAGRVDFPLDASHAVFRGSDGKAVVIYAAAVHPGELKTVESGGSVEADFSVGAQALRDGAEAAFASVREKRSFPADEFKRALKDKRMRTHYTAALRGIEAGSYELRVAWKDETGGRVSTAKLPFTAPDFEKPLAPSSLMITRDAVNGPPEIGNPLGELLAVGDTHFLPDAGTKFAAGRTLYVVYHLYNVPEAMLAQPPPVQFVVMQNQQPVSNAPSGGDAVAMKEQNQIRYRVMVQTDQLKPGAYTALVGLPQAGGGQPQILTQDFVIE